MEPNTVAIPIEWFLGTIASLGGVIAFLARTVFKIQDERRTADLNTQKEMLAAINNSTSALNKLAELIAKEP